MKVSPSVLLHDFNIIIMIKSRSDHRKVITGPYLYLFPHIPAPSSLTRRDACKALISNGNNRELPLLSQPTVRFSHIISCCNIPELFIESIKRSFAKIITPSRHAKDLFAALALPMSSVSMGVLLYHRILPRRSLRQGLRALRLRPRPSATL